MVILQRAGETIMPHLRTHLRPKHASSAHTLNGRAPRLSVMVGELWFTPPLKYPAPVSEKSVWGCYGIRVRVQTDEKTVGTAAGRGLNLAQQASKPCFGEECERGAKAHTYPDLFPTERDTAKLRWVPAHARRGGGGRRRQS